MTNMGRGLFVTMDGLVGQSSWQLWRALTLLVKVSLSIFGARKGGLLLLALMISHAPHAATQDDIFRFQAGGTPLLAIGEKVLPLGVDQCAGEVASLEVPAAADAAPNMVRIRSDVTTISPVARVNASLRPSGGRGVKSPGEQSAREGLGHAAAYTQPVQRAVMFSEERNDPKGKTYSGSVTWYTDVAAPHGSDEVQRAISAEVDVPDPQLNFVLCMAPNHDQ